MKERNEKEGRAEAYGQQVVDELELFRDYEGPEEDGEREVLGLVVDEDVLDLVVKKAEALGMFQALELRCCHVWSPSSVHSFVTVCCFYLQIETRNKIW